MGDYVCSKQADYLAYEANTLEALSEHLAAFGLPHLSEWDVIDDGETWQASVVENNDGYPDPDGEYLTDYTITVECVASTLVASVPAPVNA